MGPLHSGAEKQFLFSNFCQINKVKSSFGNIHLFIHLFNKHLVSIRDYFLFPFGDIVETNKVLALMDLTF